MRGKITQQNTQSVKLRRVHKQICSSRVIIKYMRFFCCGKYAKNVRVLRRIRSANDIDLLSEFFYACNIQSTSGFIHAYTNANVWRKYFACI